MSEYMYSFTHY